jgi:hypothetical protein
MKSKLALIAPCTSALAGSAHAETIYLTAAKMIDPVAGKVVDRPAIVIKDDKIVSVGRAGQICHIVAVDGDPIAKISELGDGASSPSHPDCSAIRPLPRGARHKKR